MSHQFLQDRNEACSIIYQRCNYVVSFVYQTLFKQLIIKDSQGCSSVSCCDYGLQWYLIFSFTNQIILFQILLLPLFFGILL